VAVFGVVVVKASQLRKVTTIDGAAIAMDELPELKLIEHFLQQGF
jgi:hypothetical protein